MLSGLLDGLAVSHVFKMSSLTLPLKAGEGLGKSACYSTSDSDAINSPTLTTFLY